MSIRPDRSVELDAGGFNELRMCRNGPMLYNKNDAFGESVASAFPSACYDIQEASNCFALDRFTACVMHCMRAIEPAIQALAVKIGAKYDNSTWGEAMKEIRVRIAAIESSPSKPSDWSEMKPFYENVIPDLGAIKDAWRNYVMHARATYDGEKAAGILDHTKRFMSQVSSKISEPPKHGAASS